MIHCLLAQSSVRALRLLQRGFSTEFLHVCRTVKRRIAQISLGRSLMQLTHTDTHTLLSNKCGTKQTSFKQTRVETNTCDQHLLSFPTSYHFPLNQHLWDRDPVDRELGTPRWTPMVDVMR